MPNGQTVAAQRTESYERINRIEEKLDKLAEAVVALARAEEKAQKAAAPAEEAPAEAVVAEEAPAEAVVAEEAPGIVDPLSQTFKLRLMPIEDIHLKSTGRFQMKPPGDMRLVISFGIIAALIIFIACVNFVNLATARAVPSFI